MSGNQVAEMSHSEREQYNSIVRENFPRNIVAFVAFEGIWGVGLPFTLLSVLIPSYLNHFSTPKLIIGAVSSIFIILTPVQLLGNRFLGGMNRKKTAWFSYFISCTGYIGYSIVGLLLPVNYRILHIILFIFSVIVFIGFIFLAQPVYYNILTDNSPLKKRGKLLGYRTMGMGIGGLLSAYPAKLLYDSVPAPTSYHIAMLISGICFVIATLSILFIRDNIDPKRIMEYQSAHRQPLFWEIFFMVRRLWKTPNYRIFIFFITLIISAGALAPFLITYAKDILGMAENQSRIFNLLFLAAAIIAGFSVGLLVDRWGYLLAATMLGVFLLAVFVIAACATELWMIFLAYGLYCCMSIPLATVMCNMSVELLPRANPAHLMAAGNMLCLPAGLIAPALCGRIIDIYSTAGDPVNGYMIVFAVAIVLAVIGGLGMTLLTQEPRTGRRYIIKILRRA